MHQYPKKILTVEQQVQSYIDAGMAVSSWDDAIQAMTDIGYYRLRGYCFQWYDNARKRYCEGTDFQSVVRLYQFDMELSHLLLSLASSIEVALRVRLTDALLVYNDALVLMDSAVFRDKELYWQNIGTLSKEISRSNDVFIKHNFRSHDGEIPLWAAVEVMSFGTLSKTIKNLSVGAGSAYSLLARRYTFQSSHMNLVAPNQRILSSWIHTVVILRNMCAHNSRIYNRTINEAPEKQNKDKITPQPRHNGLYQAVLAMKYLRPNEDVWNRFLMDLDTLFSMYQGAFELSRMNFPLDWHDHLVIS